MMKKSELRQMIREEIRMLTEKLSPKQLKIKALFDKKGGTVPDDEVLKLVRSLGAGAEWTEMKEKTYVGRKPGEKVWHWV